MTRPPDRADARTAPAATVYTRQPGPLSVVVIGDGRLSKHPLPTRGEVLIGRAPECAIRIDHLEVSRRQLLLRVGDELVLEELGSANGTRVNGELLAARTSRVVRAGDHIEIGGALLVLRFLRAEAPPAARRLIAPTAAAMARLDDMVGRVAHGAINVLVLGETGAGKEILAERIHERSPRSEHPLVRLNCAGLTEVLLERELFGHDTDAIASASNAKPGLLEVAAGGTVFLDEIGDLPLASQGRFLRLLDERTLDVRFISATRLDLEARVREGAFREDLYFRLNGVTLVVPPLRERLDELPGLVAYFIEDACRLLARQPPPTITPDAMARLRAHAWPGNVRELRNVIERAVLVSGDEPIGPEHVALSAAVADDERQRIIDALTRCNGNQSEAAKELGMPRRTLVRRIESYNLPRPRKR